MAIDRVAILLLSAFALVLPASVGAATKIDEGFATAVVTDGRRDTPANKVTQARGGDDIYYWIQRKDYPVGHTTFRCVVKSGGP